VFHQITPFLGFPSSSPEFQAISRPVSGQRLTTGAVGHACLEVSAPEDIADGIAYMVTRPRHTAIGELWIMPTDQVSV
jgi:NADP-dependent 3-hydroxy acid dehydrogenase YdfG